MTPLDPIADQALSEIPEGMLEYEARVAVRNLVRLLGFDEARKNLAFFLVDELERRTIDGHR